MTTPDFDLAEELRKERRAASAAATLLVRACQTGDVAALYGAADQINLRTVDGWKAAMRRLVREIHTVSPEIQSAFLRVWIESKMLPLKVGDQRALCDAARLLLPCYRGPAVRLFRGAGATERRRRIYGVSWSADMAVAERFALERRVMDGGSALLETLAPPAAIISAIDYPKPLAQDEIEVLKSKHPGLEIHEFHDEREYVVDRRFLNAVTVVRRYAQIGGVSVEPPRVVS